MLPSALTSTDAPPNRTYPCSAFYSGFLFRDKLLPIKTCSSCSFSIDKGSFEETTISISVDVLPYCQVLEFREKDIHEACIVRVKRRFSSEEIILFFELNSIPAVYKKGIPNPIIRILSSWPALAECDLFAVTLSSASDLELIREVLKKDISDYSDRYEANSHPCYSEFEKQALIPTSSTATVPVAFGDADDKFCLFRINEHLKEFELVFNFMKSCTSSGSGYKLKCALTSNNVLDEMYRYYTQGKASEERAIVLQFLEQIRFRNSNELCNSTTEELWNKFIETNATKKQSKQNQKQQVNQKDSQQKQPQEQQQQSKKQRNNHNTDNYMQCRKLTVTPSGIFFEGPMHEKSCRAVRTASQDYGVPLENFITVSFREESTPFAGKAADNCKTVIDRFKTVFESGINIGHLQFSLLHYSNSQLREGSAWLMAPFNNITADFIHSKLGNYQMCKNPNIRIGQHYSSTIKGPSNPRVEQIDDITSDATMLVHSDGIGLIDEAYFNSSIAPIIDKTSKQCSALQIRYGGYKGMISIAYNKPLLHSKTGEPIDLVLRPSMKKFDSNHTVIEICKVSGYTPGYLNSEAIILMEDLGVEKQVFIDFFTKQINYYKDAFKEPLVAKSIFIGGSNLSKLGTQSVLRLFHGELHYWSFHAWEQDTHVKSILHAMMKSHVADVKNKCRIHVPDAVNLLGILDAVDNVLLEGEVFIQVPNNYNTSYEQECNGINNEIKQSYRIIEGDVIVLRYPCVNPNDVLRLKAVNKPELRNYKDVIVFSQQGNMPVTVRLSKGDLDGDNYFATWDKNIVSQIKCLNSDKYASSAKSYKSSAFSSNFAAMETKSPSDVFFNFLLNNYLGQVASAWKARADREQSTNEKCLKLADLFNQQVDFQKSGKPIILDDFKALKSMIFPHYMQKAKYKSYRSDRSVGYIYDDVCYIENQHLLGSLIKNVPSTFLQDIDLMPNGNEDEDVALEIQKILKQYHAKVSKIMDRFQLKSEAFVVTAVIENNKKNTAKLKKDNASLIDALVHEAQELFKEFRIKFFKQVEEMMVTKQVFESMTTVATQWYTAATAQLANTNEVNNHQQKEKLSKKARKRQNKREERSKLCYLHWIILDVLSVIKKFRVGKSNEKQTHGKLLILYEQHKELLLKERQ